MLGARGTGKSTVGGARSYRISSELPRSKTAIIGLTYNQILNRFVPPMVSVWNQMNLVEDFDDRPGHYRLFRRPPSHWPRPYQPPQGYFNVISWANGSCQELLSLDRKDVNRGGNYDAAIIDEAVLIPKDRLDKEILPSIRGNNFRWSDNSLLHSVMMMSSAPWLPSGQWFYEFENLALTDEDVLWIESITADNIEVLGPAYLKNLERILDRVVYLVECENMRVLKLPNGFYSSFSEDLNVNKDVYEYDVDDRSGNTVTKRKDYRSDQLLSLSFDFNSAFSSCTLWQQYNNDEYAIDEIWVKDTTVDHLANKVVEQYADHKRKVVEIWGDSNGHARNPNANETSYEIIYRILTAAGWEVIMKVEPGTINSKHNSRYMVMNCILSRQDPRGPRVLFNFERCKYTIISIQSAPVNADYKKVKKSEANKSLPQERATHLSDTVDYYLFNKYQHLYAPGSGSAIFTPEFWMPS